MCGGRELKPKFLRVDIKDGVGEPALEGADLAKERNFEGEFVPRVARVANGAKWSDENVEGGEVVK